MSQAGVFTQGSVPPITVIETITGNSGGPVGPDGLLNINLLGSGPISVTGNPGTNTLTISLAGTVPEDFVTDNGTAIPSGGTLNVLGGVTSPELIANINTYADPNGSNNLKIALNNTIQWPSTNIAGTTGVLYLEGNSFLHNGANGGGATNRNIFAGQIAGNFTTTGNNLSGFGYASLFDVTTGEHCTAIGSQALAALQTGIRSSALGSLAGGQGDGDENVFVGFESFVLGSGNFNTIVGSQSGSNIAGTASNNIFMGYLSGSSYTTTESSNIIIGNIGTIADNNAIRIGTSGAGAGQQNKCFVGGIDGVNVGSTAKVVTMGTAGTVDQLGTATITAGSGITVTTGANTITIASTGADLLAYTAVNTTPYVVLTTDEFLGVDCSGGPITIQLPNAPSTGRVFMIKDSQGAAFSNTITVTTVGGVVTIDNATTYAMNTQYAAINVIFNGTAYEVW